MIHPTLVANQFFCYTHTINFFTLIHIKLKKKMSHESLLSGLSEDRRLFVWKVFNEMDDNAFVNTSDRENQKVHFLQLVEKNKELSEIEKRYCRERFIYLFELNNALNKLGKPRECNKCKNDK